MKILMNIKILKNLISEIRDVSNQYPIMQDRIEALKEVGYDTIHYK